MNDVARRAGVSVATVSNTLNRPQLVTESTRLRVQEAIGELGFVRNSTARSLKLGVVNTVGLVLVDLGNSFFVDIARGAEGTTQEHGLSLMIANADVDLQRQDHYLNLFNEARVSGILLAPLDASLEHVSSARTAGRPVVLVNYAARGYCGVVADDELGGHLAARHLIEQGRTRLAFVGGPLTLGAVEARMRGAQRAADEAGLALVHLPTQSLNASEGRRIAAQIARMPARRRFDGVVTAADTLAMACVQDLTAVHGLTVPGEVAVTGYDDNHFASDGPIPLSTVRQPGPAMGAAAAGLLLAELTGRPQHRHRTLTLKPSLVVRNSSVDTPHQPS
ncbi:transcriptional regulator [Kineosporia sp. NBRC 101677]|nr:transcriptional regulator [Kineosporia sp. NBRC 101677]